MLQPPLRPEERKSGLTTQEVPRRNTEGQCLVTRRALVVLLAALTAAGIRLPSAK